MRTLRFWEQTIKGSVLTGKGEEMIEALKRWLRSGNSHQEKKEVKCFGCGKCCESFGGHLHASPVDIERWQRLGRADLLGRVNRLGWIWVDPQTQRLEERCPFLERTGPETAHCTIHEIKPDICRAYPTLAHARRCLSGVFLNIPVILGGIPVGITAFFDDLLCLI
jgi:Fe-S-cluster containining protein